MILVMLDIIQYIFANVVVFNTECVDGRLHIQTPLKPLRGRWVWLLNGIVFHLQTFIRTGITL